MMQRLCDIRLLTGRATPLRYRGVGWLRLVFILLCAAAVPIVQPGGNKLPAGRKPGTYHFAYHGRVRFTLKPEYPTVVSVRSDLTGEVARTKVSDAKPFTLQADLAPGTYWIGSDVVGHAVRTQYLPTMAGMIFIDRDGNLWPAMGLDGTLVHVHRMPAMSPSNMEIARENPPVLTWPAVHGAKTYEGEYRVGEISKSFETGVPHYKLPELKPSERCEWQMRALDDKGQILAGGMAAFFAHGTDSRTVEMARWHIASPGAVWPPASGGYMGIAPIAGSVTKDPTKTIRSVKGPETTIILSSDELIPCIEVTEVAPGSPALNAGLRPGDFIIAVDENPISPQVIHGTREGDLVGFQRHVRAMRPGATATFTVRRDGKELKIPVVIGLPPHIPSQTRPAIGR